LRFKESGNERHKKRVRKFDDEVMTMEAEKQEAQESINELLDNEVFGRAESDIPMDYLAFGKNHFYKCMKRLKEVYRDKTVENAVRKANAKARTLCGQHIAEVEMFVPDEDKRHRLTTIYINKYKNRMSLIGWKRFCVQNAELTIPEMDREFNQSFNWLDYDVAND